MISSPIIAQCYLVLRCSYWSTFLTSREYSYLWPVHIYLFVGEMPWVGTVCTLYRGVCQDIRKSFSSCLFVCLSTCLLLRCHCYVLSARCTGVYAKTYGRASLPQSIKCCSQAEDSCPVILSLTFHWPFCHQALSYKLKVLAPCLVKGDWYSRQCI